MKRASKCPKVGVNSKQELEKSVGFGESLNGEDTATVMSKTGGITLRAKFIFSCRDVVAYYLL